jgi:hypothetical protein
MDDITDIVEVIKKLRGFFPTKVYIGGSFAYSKASKIPWNGKDVDTFILIPRMEQWALKHILNSIFDEIEISKDSMGQYKLKPQWKRVVAKYNEIVFDLIFVDTLIDTLIDEYSSSNLTQNYYSLDYREYPEFILARTIFREGYATDFWIKKSKCTKEHLEKLLNIFKEYNIDFKYI